MPSYIVKIQTEVIVEFAEGHPDPTPQEIQDEALANVTRHVGTTEWEISKLS